MPGARVLRSTERVELALRVGVGVVLVLAGIAKLVAPNATAQVIESHGIPDGMVLGVIAGACESCVGVLILLGRWVRRIAFALVLFYVPIAFVFHFPFGLGHRAMAQQALDIAFDLVVIGALWALATRRETGGAR